MGHETRPASTAFKVTKSDTLRLDSPAATGGFNYGAPRALNCGTAGTANLVDAGGRLLTDYPLQQGYNPISVRQVRTGGTADDIWALY